MKNALILDNLFCKVETVNLWNQELYKGTVINKYEGICVCAFSFRFNYIASSSVPYSLKLLLEGESCKDV